MRIFFLLSIFTFFSLSADPLAIPGNAGIDVLSRIKGDYLLFFAGLILLGILVYAIRRAKRLWQFGSKLSDSVERLELEMRELYTIARKDKDQRIRIAAASQIPDQKLLFNLCMKESDPQVSLTAARKLTDLRLLEELGRTCPLPEVRSLAVEYLGESKKYTDWLFAELVASEKDQSVRRSIVKNISDQQLLLQLFGSETDTEMKIAAVSALSDQKILAEIIRTEKNWAIRQEAVKNCSDEKLLSLLADSDEFYQIRLAATKKLANFESLSDYIQKTENQSFLCDIAKNETDEKIAMEALSRVTLQGELTEIAVSASSWNLRKHSMLKLTSTTRLLDAIASMSEKKDLPSLKEILNDIVSHEEDWKICKAAAGFLDSQELLEKTEQDFRQSEVYSIWNILKESLYARRLMIELKKMGFISAARTEDGIECRSQEGSLLVMVSSQYVYYCIYTFREGEQMVLVLTQDDGVGKVAGEYEVYSALRRLNNHFPDRIERIKAEAEAKIAAEANPKEEAAKS
ncbi:MAG: hypothetical protein PHW04_14570 [Candidatus Wallbacteria bacterium]|nr:hypothetical protein [Candidatus Wallbacteria bacterium]